MSYSKQTQLAECESSLATEAATFASRIAAVIAKEARKSMEALLEDVRSEGTRRLLILAHEASIRAAEKAEQAAAILREAVRDAWDKATEASREAYLVATEAAFDAQMASAEATQESLAAAARAVEAARAAGEKAAAAAIAAGGKAAEAALEASTKAANALADARLFVGSDSIEGVVRFLMDTTGGASIEHKSGNDGLLEYLVAKTMSDDSSVASGVSNLLCLPFRDENPTKTSLSVGQSTLMNASATQGSVSNVAADHVKRSVTVYESEYRKSPVVSRMGPEGLGQSENYFPAKSLPPRQITHEPCSKLTNASCSQGDKDEETEEPSGTSWKTDPTPCTCAKEIGASVADEAYRNIPPICSSAKCRNAEHEAVNTCAAGVSSNDTTEDNDESEDDFAMALPKFTEAVSKDRDLIDDYRCMNELDSLDEIISDVQQARRRRSKDEETVEDIMKFINKCKNAIFASKRT